MEVRAVLTVVGSGCAVDTRTPEYTFVVGYRGGIWAAILVRGIQRWIAFDVHIEAKTSWPFVALASAFVHIIRREAFIEPKII